MDYSYLLKQDGQNRDIPRPRGIFIGRQARALLNAMAYFENGRYRGRAGRGPILVPNNGIGRAVGWGRGLPHEGSWDQV